MTCWRNREQCDPRSTVGGGLATRGQLDAAGSSTFCARSREKPPQDVRAAGLGDLGPVRVRGGRVGVGWLAEEGPRQAGSGPRGLERPLGVTARPDGCVGGLGQAPALGRGGRGLGDPGGRACEWGAPRLGGKGGSRWAQELSGGGTGRRPDCEGCKGGREASG